MDSDDVVRGRILSRREVLTLLGGAGVAAVGVPAIAGALDHSAQPPRPQGAAPVPNCVVRPEQTEGPYFVDQTLNRRDVRSDPTDGRVPEGLPLELEIRVSGIVGGACTPLSGARVEIWQCDALGVYSGVQDIDGQFDTRGQSFLRGHQITDRAGSARFRSIYPGWYRGRTVHIHFAVHATNRAGRDVVFTSQLYFDDAVTESVLRQAPYSQKGLDGWMKNDADGIFRRQRGAELLLATRPLDGGYAAQFELGMQLG